jgi:hypothetical protein
MMRSVEAIQILRRFTLSLESLRIPLDELPKANDDDEGDEEKRALIIDRYQLNVAHLLSSFTSLTKLHVTVPWALYSENDNSSYVWELPQVTTLIISYQLSNDYYDSDISFPHIICPKLHEFYFRIWKTNIKESVAMANLLPLLTPLMTVPSLTILELPMMATELIPPLAANKSLRQLFIRRWLTPRTMKELLSHRWDDITLFEMGGPKNVLSSSIKDANNTLLTCTLLTSFPSLTSLHLFGYSPYQYSLNGVAASSTVITTNTNTPSSSTTPTSTSSGEGKSGEILPSSPALVINMKLKSLLMSQDHLDVELLCQYSFPSLTLLTLSGEMNQIEIIPFILRCTSLTTISISKFFTITDHVREQIESANSSFMTSITGPSSDNPLPVGWALPSLSSLTTLIVREALFLPFLSLLTNISSGSTIKRSNGCSHTFHPTNEIDNKLPLLSMESKTTRHSKL